MDKQSDITAKLANMLHEVAGEPWRKGLSDTEADVLRKAEQHLIDLQRQVDDLMRERADYLAPANPDADCACPFCGGAEFEGDPSGRTCSTCHATGPDEFAPNSFEGDWNTRSVPPGAAIAEQLRRVVEACGEVALSDPKASSEISKSTQLLKSYDAVAACGRSAEPRLPDEDPIRGVLKYEARKK